MGGIDEGLLEKNAEDTKIGAGERYHRKSGSGDWEFQRDYGGDKWEVILAEMMEIVTPAVHCRVLAGINKYEKNIV